MLGDRTDEIKAEQAVMQQWTRAEPGFRRVTAEEFEADCASFETEQAAQLAVTARQRETPKAAYDREREMRRVEFLECDAYLAKRRLEREGLQAGTLFPSMPADRREQQIRECEKEIAARAAVVDRLRIAVGDPESVVAQHGFLPAERREFALTHFS